MLSPEGWKISLVMIDDYKKEVTLLLPEGWNK